jgi:Legionella pneumophila major outer membrane protein precursor
MYHQIKKLLPAAAASLVFFTGIAEAATATNNPTYSNNSAKRRQERDATPPARPHTSSSSWGLTVSGDFLWWKAVQENLEYVVAINEGTNCNPCNTVPPFLEFDSFNGKDHKPQFDYEPGFRIGINYVLPYDGWDLNVVWTRLHSKASDKRCAFPREAISSASSCCNGFCNNCFSPNCGGCGSCSINDEIAIGRDFKSNCTSLNPCGNCSRCCSSESCDCCEPTCGCCEVVWDCGCPTLLLPTLNGYGSTFDAFTSAATAKWRLELNLLDGELGREFYVSRHLTLRPFIGLRGAWVNQKLNVAYQSDIEAEDQEVFQDNFYIEELSGCKVECTKYKYYFQGVGPRAGLYSDWMLGMGFSIYGSFALNLVWGEIENHTTTNAFFCGSQASFVTTNMTSLNSDSCFDTCSKLRYKQRYWAGKAITDLALGVQWEKLFMKDRLGLIIQVGYDHKMFFDQWEGSALTVPTFLRTKVPHVNYREKRHGNLTVQGLSVSAALEF